jgi:hypothetical protein
LKRAQANLQKQEKILRRRASDIIFDEEEDLFRGMDSRKYSNARFTLVELLLKSNTAQAVMLSLDHLIGMLRLCRADPMGVRDVVPALYLRLGRDQEAFDFCHWWATTGHGDDYDWSNYQAPYLDTKNADVLSGIDIFLGNQFYLPHAVALTLLNIRLMVDLQVVQQARQHIGPHVPREILDVIEQYSVHSSICSASKTIEQGDQKQHVAGLRKRIKKLHAAVEKANRYFWPALIEPGDNLEARPTLYGPGDQGQMQLVLQHNYTSYSETPGAIKIIAELSRFSTNAFETISTSQVL